MSFGQILEVLKRMQKDLFRNLYEGYFFGEWTIPWLPDDL